MTWRCARCHQTFTAWSRAQAHADEAHGGGRVELVLPGVGGTHRDAIPRPAPDSRSATRAQTFPNA
jgi:hypothetical protein